MGFIGEKMAMRKMLYSGVMKIIIEYLFVIIMV